jgi:cytochrome b subunit of formate dehydrogenase
MPTMNIKRFSVVDRLFHLGLMLTFLIQAATGFSRLYITTTWGKKLCYLFGGYENAGVIHHWVGSIMTALFVVHVICLLTKIKGKRIFGPDSLIPNLYDFRNVWKKFLWFFGIGSPPELERWAYWEKFDYWAVFWGLPLLAVTGLMLMYPIASSRIMPGWGLNVAALLHKAEAILAVAYIFIVHFFIGHLRPSSFPMNEGMFSGGVSLEDAMEEKPVWVKRLKEEGNLELAMTSPPTLWFRVIYFIFGYAALGFGIYLMVNLIVYSRYVSLH